MTESVRSMLRALSDEQLERLHAAVERHRGKTIDLAAAIDAIRQTPVGVPADSKWRAEISGGRGYELILMAQDAGLPDPFEWADTQYQHEWTEVEVLTATGVMADADAWRIIRARNGVYGGAVVMPVLAGIRDEDARGDDRAARPIPRAGRGSRNA